MSKSTMIRDLNPNKQKEQINEDDVTIQEVLTEIESDKFKTEPVMDEVPVSNVNDLKNQILQQQLLQQQLLQQQLLQQQQQQINVVKTEQPIPTPSSDSGLISKYAQVALHIITSKKKEFFGILCLHLLFNKIDLNVILKIDKLNIFATYPYLESVFRSTVFSLIAIIVSYIV